MRRGFIASGSSRSKFDLEQAVFEGRALHLDIVGEVETPLKWTARNAAIEILALVLLLDPRVPVTSAYSG